MSGPTDRGAGSIELNFCQRCGISIPIADIDRGRAPPAPGGFLCGGCAYQERDEGLAPRPVARAGRAPREGGSRALLAVAMLYVVGATTFLLVREINRKPVSLTLPQNLASTRDVQDVSEVVADVDRRMRQAFTQLKNNDDAQVAAFSQMLERVGELRDYVAKQVTEGREVDRDVVAGLLKVLERTVGLKRDIPDILEQLRAIQRKLEGLGGSGEGPVARTPDPVTPPPAEDTADRERRAQAEVHIAKLTDPKSPDQARYNAAVELGDLKHPSAVDPLIGVLRNDPSELVRRAAAWALGEMGKEAVRAIPALIEQLGGKEEYVGYMCERALGDITKACLGAAKSFKYDPTMSQRQRKQIQKQWEDWWEKNKDQLGG